MSEPVNSEVEQYDPSGKQHGTIVTTDRSWKPAPIASMSESDFTQRVQLAAVEVKRMAEIQKAIMKDGIDYGTVPGIGKPMLFQPGAQILNRFTGLRPKYIYNRLIGDGIDSPTIAITVECGLFDGDDREVGQGLGSANSWETKHRYRYTEKVCPQCGVAAARSSQYDEKYYCDKRKDGCGAKFKEGTEAAKILDTQPTMGENPDPHDLDNTILKMACKRAYIAATVNTHACSGQFSQEFTDEGEATDEKPTSKQRSQARKSKAKAKPKTTREDEPDASLASEAQKKLMFAKLANQFANQNLEYTDESRHFAQDDIFTELFLDEKTGEVSVDSFADVPRNKVDAVLDAISAWGVDKE